MYTFLNFVSLKFTKPQSFRVKQVFTIAPCVPICVSRISSSSAISFILCSTVIYDFSNVMNGSIQNVCLSISILHISSSMVVTFANGVRLLILQLCLRNISWFPGNITQRWPYSFNASSKNLYDADKTSISRYLRSWNRSPSTNIVSMLATLQYSRMVLHAYRMSSSRPGTPKWMSAVIAIWFIV